MQDTDSDSRDPEAADDRGRPAGSWKEAQSRPRADSPSKGGQSPLRRSPSRAGRSFRAAKTAGREEEAAEGAGTMKGLLEKVRRGGQYVGLAFSDADRRARHAMLDRSESAQVRPHRHVCSEPLSSRI